jgi:hypothetical protein
MEVLSCNDLENINGGDRELYQLVWSTAATVVTGGNGYVGAGVGYASGKHYDYIENKYKNHVFDPSTYKHPYRDLN